MLLYAAIKIASTKVGHIEFYYLVIYIVKATEKEQIY